MQIVFFLPSFSYVIFDRCKLYRTTSPSFWYGNYCNFVSCQQPFQHYNCKRIRKPEVDGFFFLSSGVSDILQTHLSDIIFAIKSLTVHMSFCMGSLFILTIKSSGWRKNCKMDQLEGPSRLH